MTQTSCSYCGTVRTDADSWCVRCFMPFEADATEATAPATEPEPAAPTGDGGSDFAAAPAIPAQPTPAMPELAFAAQPAASAPPVDSRFSWTADPTVPVSTILSTPQSVVSGRPERRRLPRWAWGGGVAALLVGVVALVWWQTLPNEKKDIAEQFISGKPAIAVPDFDAGLARLTSGDVADTPANAAAGLQPLDAPIRAANDALIAAQDTFRQWADGSLTDEQLVAENREFIEGMQSLSLAIDSAVYEAPHSLASGLTKLGRAATDYSFAVTELNDYLVAGARGARVTFYIGVASANENWDTALVSTYRAAGLQPPPLPDRD